jgi:hypothetical protein
MLMAWSYDNGGAFAFSPLSPQLQFSRLKRTTQLFSTSADDDPFMKSLQTRIHKANQIPLIFRDTLLPRQLLQMTIKHGVVLDLVKSRIQEESPYFGLVGIRQQGGAYMTRGVEVQLIDYEINEWKTGVRLRLKAGRRFEIDEELIESEDGWTESQVRFLDSSEQEAAESDMMNKAVAMQQAKEFMDPNNSMNEAKSLVDMWLELARTKERYDGQIDQLLQELGDIPEWNEPSECAFWVGALINPTPALGLAVDIRQELLMADTAQERTQIALDALWNSIQRMDPSPRFKVA